MAEIRTDNIHYKNIADAIREKTGSVATYYPEDMADAIRGLSLDAKCNLVVQADWGSVVAASKPGEATQYPVERNGIWVFGEMASGEWLVMAQSEDGSKEVTRTVKITKDGPACFVRLTFGPKLNDFSLKNLGSLGIDYIVQYDNGDIIPEEDWEEAVNWRILIYNTTTISVTKDCNVDVFLVGGGGGGGGAYGGGCGGGGGGGYTTTIKNTFMMPNQEYSIIIGTGGTGVDYNKTGGTGGTTSISNIGSASGGLGGIGKNGDKGAGGAGGSGGGYGAYNGGYGGGNGSTYTGGNGAQGQGTPTTEFGESNNYLYAGGGGGGYSGIGGYGGGGSGIAGGQTSGTVNTGGGGSGGHATGSFNVNGGSGGSGIVIIRNARST